MRGRGWEEHPPTHVSSEGGVVVALEWAGGALHEKKALNKGTKL